GLGQFAGLQLVAERGERLRGRADEGQPVRRALPGEVRPLGQEPVPGVDGGAAGGHGGVQHGGDRQVAADGVRAAEDHDPPGPARCQRVAVGAGDAEHGLEAEPVARLDDAERDLAAVGDEDTLSGGAGGHAIVLMAKSGLPYSTSSPSAAKIFVTSPDTPAGTEFMSFMTSTMQSTVSGATLSPISTYGGSPGLGER